MSPDFIIHFINKEKKYQWMYCLKDADKTKTGEFEAKNFRHQRERLIYSKRQAQFA